MKKTNQKPLKAPRLAGGLLKVLTPLVEHPPLGGAISAKLFSDIGISALRGIESEEVPEIRPPGVPASSGALAGARESAAETRPLPPASPPGADFVPECVFDFYASYREQKSDPTAVARAALDWQKDLENMSPPLRALIAQDGSDLTAQAEASRARYLQGKPLSALDGVPVAVKDELDLTGYPTGVGTKFLGKTPAEKDAEVVSRLRAAGAVLIGKANMHEIGLGVTGINPHHGPARNPHDPSRITGGSSSGPAAAVACGLCPIAVGADGGGSIRIPAALCGVVGLKATFGRLSERGAAPLCWSVAHLGPIAATACDCALGYYYMAGPDPADPHTLDAPPVSLEGFDIAHLKGIRLGLMPAWFEQADPEVVTACRRLLDEFRGLGAEIKEIDIENLEIIRPVHLVIIVSEMTAAHLGHYRRHRKQYGHDTRMNLALARRLRAFDYIQAQRLRAAICRSFDRALGTVDAIVTPATGCTATPIRKDALRSGESNLELTEKIMRFAPAANLTGLPAISFPAGHDGQGLPVGMQVMGRAWSESLLLRMARVAEGLVPRRRPKVHRRLIVPGS